MGGMLMEGMIKSVKSICVQIGPFADMDAKGIKEGLDLLDCQINEYIKNKGSPLSITISLSSVENFNVIGTAIVATLAYSYFIE